MAFVNGIILEQVIILMKNEPAYRDDRQGTVIKIIKDCYSHGWGQNVKNDCKLAWNIDRAFRWVQQHIPSLRGKEWWWRQYKSGEISKEDYMMRKRADKETEELLKQLKIEFE